MIWILKKIKEHYSRLAGEAYIYQGPKYKAKRCRILLNQSSGQILSNKLPKIRKKGWHSSSCSQSCFLISWFIHNKRASLAWRKNDTLLKTVKINFRLQRRSMHPPSRFQRTRSPGAAQFFCVQKLLKLNRKIHIWFAFISRSKQVISLDISIEFLVTKDSVILAVR